MSEELKVSTSKIVILPQKNNKKFDCSSALSIIVNGTYLSSCSSPNPESHLCFLSLFHTPYQMHQQKSVGSIFNICQESQQFSPHSPLPSLHNLRVCLLTHYTLFPALHTYRVLSRQQPGRLWCTLVLSTWHFWFSIQHEIRLYSPIFSWPKWSEHFLLSSGMWTKEMWSLPEEWKF